MEQSRKTKNVERKHQNGNDNLYRVFNLRDTIFDLMVTCTASISQLEQERLLWFFEKVNRYLFWRVCFIVSFWWNLSFNL